MNNLYEFEKDDAFRFASFVMASVKPKGDELQFQYCPYCRGGKHRDKNTFSINLKNGQCVCQRSSCGIKGNMITLARDFDFELSENVTRYYNVANFNGSFKKFIEAHIEVKEPAIKYLESRGISRATAEKYEITTHKDDDNRLVFPFRDEAGELKLIKYRNTAFVKGESKGNKEWCEANCMPILFGMNHCDADISKTLVLTEGQLDSLSLSEAGIPNAVSVPFGVNGFTWIPHCWDFVDQFDTIIVFGDFENGNITLVDDISKKFKKRVLKIREKDYQQCKDANEILQKYGSQALKDAISRAEELPVKMIVDLSEIEPVNVFDIPKLQTGIGAVDKLLYGGLPFGGLTLVTGKAGEGKSTLASQILVSAIGQNHKCFAYSGELPNHMFKAWMNYQVAGNHHTRTHTNTWGDTEYSISESTQKEIDDFYRGKCFLYDNSDIDGDEKDSLISITEEAILHYGVDVVLIDNLMTALDLENIESFDKYDKQSMFVKKLARIALKHNVLIILVAHKRKNNMNMNTNDEIAGSADIGNLATLTISYERDQKIEADNRLLKITKNRLFGKLNTDGFVTKYSDQSKRIFMDISELQKEYLNTDTGFADIPSEDMETIPF